MVSDHPTAGGGPADDKPDVVAKRTERPAPRVLFVPGLQAAYRDGTKRGATFLPSPKPCPRGLECFMRDPDGSLIQVAQRTVAPPS